MAQIPYAVAVALDIVSLLVIVLALALVVASLPEVALAAVLAEDGRENSRENPAITCLLAENNQSKQTFIAVISNLIAISVSNKDRLLGSAPRSVWRGNHSYD